MGGIRNIELAKSLFKHCAIDLFNWILNGCNITYLMG
jgi:hypothetical protein